MVIAVGIASGRSTCLPALFADYIKEFGIKTWVRGYKYFFGQSLIVIFHKLINGGCYAA